MKLTRSAAVLGAGFVVAGLAVPQARADDALGLCYDQLRHAVEAQLAGFPGGTLVGPDTISYGGGAVVVMIRPESCPFQPADLRSGRTTPAMHLWNEQAGVENHWAFTVIGRWVNISGIPHQTRYWNARSAVFWSNNGKRGAVTCHSGGARGVPSGWGEIYLSANTTRCQ